MLFLSLNKLIFFAEAYSKMKNKLVKIDSEICRSCNTEFQGAFCHVCGQKRIYNRFNLKESCVWVSKEIFNLDRGFFFTSKEMIIRPGVVLKEYLSGATKKYMHPFRFLFVWATINSLLTIWLGVFDDIGQIESMGFDFDEKGKQRFKETMAVIKKYSTFIVMLGVPFMALTSHLVYRSRKLFYTEHLIVNAFAYAGSIILSVPFVMLYIMPDGIVWHSNINMLLYVLYFGYVYHKLFKEHYIQSLIKFVLMNIATILVASIIAIIVIIVVTLIYAQLFKS